jgi:hypothetical protein
MKIRIYRWCIFKLISLLSFSFLAVQIEAQDNVLNPINGLTNSRAKTGKTRLASAADVASGFSFETLYSFCSAANCTDGNVPAAGLTQDPAGNLYGTTTEGGANSNSACGSSGCGIASTRGTLSPSAVAILRRRGDCGPVVECLSWVSAGAHP